MRYIIKTTGEVVSLPSNTGPMGLAAMQAAVGGCIEAVHGTDLRDKLVYVNEDGILMGLPPNPSASELLGRHIVGDVLVLDGWEERMHPDIAWAKDLARLRKGDDISDAELNTIFWDSLTRSYVLEWKGMTLNIETDGYIHT